MSEKKKEDRQNLVQWTISSGTAPGTVRISSQN